MWGGIEQKIQTYRKKDIQLIRSAFLMAERCHSGQKRRSGEPYISHPVAVAEKIIMLKLDASTVAAGLLHDVMEDSDITYGEIESATNSNVAFLVEALTNLDNVRYRGIERKIESTRKMFLAVAEDIRVVLIKLADRLHNMRTIKALPREKQVRIAKETIELYAPLAYRLGMSEIKDELDDLAFPIVYREEYEWLEREVQEHISKRKKYLEAIAPLVDGELKKNGVKVLNISYRAKHYFSIWKKLLKHNLDMNSITDLAALRIIVPTVEDCYKSLGIIHAAWRPLPGKIKDYISFPKSNGYRSLHTTVFCEDNRITEFQIRTPQMQEEAEFGIAAHWAYDEAGKPKEGAKAYSTKTAWIKKLHEWQKEFEEHPSDEFFEALKIDFFKDRIFILTPKGEVIDLPDGATPIDFAYHIHSDIGNRMSGAKVNGKLVSFAHTLISGDTVEIITGKNARPKADWIAMVKSSLARGHIRSALRKAGIDIAAKHVAKPSFKMVTVSMHINDRIGLLKDVTLVLSKQKINILRIEDIENAVLTLHLQVRKNCEIKTLAKQLKKIKGIKEIEIKQ